MLLFQRHFLPLIRAGTKTQTIRLWSRPRVKPGQHAFVPGLHQNPARSRVLILSITPLQSLQSLTRADAIADGIPSRRQLLAQLRRLYPCQSPRRTRHIFRIRFAYPHNSGRKPGAEPLAREVLIPPPITSAPNPPRRAKTAASRPRHLATPSPKPQIKFSSAAARRQLARFLRHLPASRKTPNYKST